MLSKSHHARLCGIHIYVTGHRNLTVSLPEELIQQLRVLAAGRAQSMTSIIKRALELEIQQKDEHEQATNRMIDHMRNSPDCGLHGKITWTRDDLYDRGQ